MELMRLHHNLRIMTLLLCKITDRVYNFKNKKHENENEKGVHVCSKKEKLHYKKLGKGSTVETPRLGTLRKIYI